jgi:hypothetical protein
MALLRLGFDQFIRNGIAHMSARTTVGKLFYAAGLALMLITIAAVVVIIGLIFYQIFDVLFLHSASLRQLVMKP